MSSAVSAVQIWLRRSVPWWSACARRIPTVAFLRQPSSSSTSSRTVLGSRSRAEEIGPLERRAAPVRRPQLPEVDVVLVEEGRTGPRCTRNRYDASELTVCRIVTRIA